MDRNKNQGENLEKALPRQRIISEGEQRAMESTDAQEAIKQAHRYKRTIYYSFLMLLSNQNTEHTSFSLT